MARDPMLARATEEVERRRQALWDLEKAIRVAVAEADAASSSGSGLWSMLVGAPDDDDGREVEQERITAMRAQLEGHRQSLVAAEERLEAARQQAETEGRVERAEPKRLQERAREALAGGMDAHAMLAVQELEDIVRRLRRTADKLIVETRAAQAAEAAEASRGRLHYRRRGNALGALVRSLAELHQGSSGSMTPIESLWVDWARDAQKAERVAQGVGIDLSLPRDGAGGAFVLEGLGAELDGMMEVLREAQRTVGAGPSPGGGPTADASQLGELVAGWERLLILAEALDKAAVPGARTVHLLAPMTAWNRQAKQVATQAQRCSVPLVPPVNEGGELHAFIDGVRAALPSWREELEVLRAMAGA